MTWKELDQITGGLSEPGKMPGWAWGTPAKRCQTGSKLATVPGTVCHGCYALKGRCGMPQAVRAQERRFAAMQLAHTSPEARERFVGAMVESIERKARGKGGPWFRWFDTGDLQGPADLDLIAGIARLTPGVDHWLPTREYTFVKEYLIKWNPASGIKLSLCSLSGLIKWNPVNLRPDNLTIRLSGHKVLPQVGDLAIIANGCLPPKMPGTVFSTVHRSGAVFDDEQPIVSFSRNNVTPCPARKQGNVCGDCRACWDKDVAWVSYEKH